MSLNTVVLHGDDLAYERHEGTGTPLLLVHGVGSSTATWSDLIVRLRDAGRTVVAVDLLGHGESGHGNGDFSLGSNASRLRDLLDHLGIDRVHLVGHSLGGGVAMQFQYQFPQRVQSMTLISSGGLGAEVSLGLRAASLPGSEVVFRMISSERGLTWVQRATRGLVATGGMTAGMADKTIAKLRRLRDDRRRKAFLATVRSVVGPQGQLVRATDRFGAVRDPSTVLIIWGDADATVPMSHGVQAHELLPGSRFVAVPGAGHHPHVDAPDLVGESILRHVLAVESV
ncbi:MAG: alpha/beta fold hydrolase [Candidatus Nanopelagicales bacterium]